MQKILFFLFLFLPLCAIAQPVELGLPTGHTGTVYNLRFSQDGALLFSAGEDASLMLWDVATGKLLKSSVKAGGAVMPGAIASPNLQYVQYNKGWQDYRPLFFSFRNPENRGMNLRDDPFQSFSADGQWGMKQSGGLARLDNPADSLPAPDFKPDGFTPDGRYFYKIREGQIQFWDAVTQDPMQFQSLNGLSPYAKFWAYGKILGDEVEYSIQYNFWSTETGTFLYRLEVPEGYQLRDIAPDGSFVILVDEQGQFRKYDPVQQVFMLTYTTGSPTTNETMMLEPPAARLSPDGQMLACSGLDGTLYLLDANTGQRIRTLRAHHLIPADLAYSENGEKLSFTSASGLVHTWDLEACRKETPEAPINIYNSISLSEGAFREQTLTQQGIKATTADGQTGVRFERSDRDYTPVLVNLQNMEPIRSLAPANLGHHSVRKAIFSNDGRRLLLIPTTELQEGTTCYVWDVPSGKILHRFPDPEDSYALSGAFSSEGNQLLLGTWNRAVHLYNLTNGQLLHTFRGHRGKVQALAFAPNGNYFASGAEDGQVKIWSIPERKEIATLILIDKDDWIVLSPQGLFDASQNAMRLLYYLVETGQRTEIIELEQLKARYYEPGLLQKLLGYLPEPVRSVEGLARVALYPALQAGIQGDQLKVALEARSGGIGRVSIQVNGKEVAYDADPDRKPRFSFDLRPVHPYLLRHPDSTNRISIQAYNAEGWLKSRPLHLNYEPVSRTRGNTGNSSSSWTGELDPKMYVVTVGTSDYNGEALDLKYATQDAIAMARSLALVGANLFANGDSIEVHCLTTTPANQTGLEGTNISWQYASKANIQRTLQSIQQKAKAEDVLLVYLSGHGLAFGNGDREQFYYLTHDVANTDMIMDAEVRDQYTIPSSELTEWINDIPALKQVLVIDACNSGQAVEDLSSGTRNLNASQIRALDRMKDRTGMFILSGSAADKVSFEASEYGQGLLTYALLQGIQGLATTRTADGEYVDVMTLFQHARDEVPRLAASIMGVQTPTLGFPANASSFDIGIVKYEQPLPIGKKKPVLIRTTFLNEATLTDDLQLMQQLENTFRRENEKAASADYLFIDASDYPGAYALRGLYTQADGEIRFSKILLFRGQFTSFPLDIAPNSDPGRIVKEIERAVKKIIKRQSR